MSRGIFLTYTNCTDPLREMEFNQWYSHTHLSDLSATEGFISARRFVSGAQLGNPSRYLTMFELEGEDLQETVQSLGRTTNRTWEAGTHFEAMDVINLELWQQMNDGKPSQDVGRGLFFNVELELGAWDSPLGLKQPVTTLPRGILMVRVECREDDQRALEDWNIHSLLPAYSGFDGVRSTTPFVGLAPFANQPPIPKSYMNLHEFDSAEPLLWLGRFVQELRAQFSTSPLRSLQGVEIRLYVEVDASSFPPLSIVEYPRRISS